MVSQSADVHVKKQEKIIMSADLPCVEKQEVMFLLMLDHIGGKITSFYFTNSFFYIILFIF